jgi:DDE superfamily endonuclease
LLPLPCCANAAGEMVRTAVDTATVINWRTMEPPVWIYAFGGSLLQSKWCANMACARIRGTYPAGVASRPHVLRQKSDVSDAAARPRARTPAGLDLHLIVDDFTTHRTPAVKHWIKANHRFHLHFAPTSTSWLNMVGGFFAEITRNRSRRGRECQCGIPAEPQYQSKAALATSRIGLDLQEGDSVWRARECRPASSRSHGPVCRHHKPCSPDRVVHAL